MLEGGGQQASITPHRREAASPELAPWVRAWLHECALDGFLIAVTRKPTEHEAWITVDSHVLRDKARHPESTRVLTTSEQRPLLLAVRRVIGKVEAPVPHGTRR